MNTLGELLRSRTYLTPNLEAVVSAGKRITYKEYASLVNRLANFLLQRNVGKGDRIAFLLSNDYPFPLIFLAAAKIGAIAVPINWRLKPAEIGWILQDSGAKLLFFDHAFQQAIAEIGNLPELEEAIRIYRDENHDSFADLLSYYPDTEPNLPVEEYDPAIIIYTSGTTGKPKGVVCSHKNIYAAGLANINTLDLRLADRFLFVTPLFHISGMMFIINAIIRGMTLILAPQFNPVQLWDLVEAEKITGMMSVPSMLTYMLETAKSCNRDTTSLRSIVCGGSLVPPHLIKGMYELGYSINQVYGATEFTGAITYWMPNMGLDKCHSVGKGLYLTEIKILDPVTGEELPPGEYGEVVVRGEQVFLGYWKNNEESQKVIHGGWYYTKDVGKLDEDGFLYIIDRLRDMIICSGEKVFPAEVESILMQLEEISDVAVVGVKHPVWGELPRAYVVLKEGALITADKILAHARKHLADYKLYDVEFIDELPKNSMGKTLKYLLRKYANQE
ncbi:AMP-binding protein [Thermoactinomyces daqus]|uniref:AMP-binding protein n=1 Tax=Thermoactinomyces daqus TaxID=1329516 RepID=A0A7W1X9S6_9BACL|nr:AMP-binding protein [Thermoactinomyces daqus]MBA4542763.1 AMP-binding protein [Thermoactinomyces daqus]